MKKVLVVHWSQTGQLTRAAKSFAGPLVDDPLTEVTFLELEPVKPFPFPWPFITFFDAFPESVYLDGPALKPFAVPDGAAFDLVVLAYQTWFLSPSPPITAFLQTPQAKRWLDGTPVITLIACRNMWVMGQEKMKRLIQEAGGRLIDNVVLVDKGGAFETFITTPYWMFTGKRDFGCGLTPAGVSDEDIAGAARFGRALKRALHRDEERGEQPLLHGLQAVAVNPKLILSEAAAHRGFRLWGRLLRRLGPPGRPIRRCVLVLYAAFLMTFIATFVPLSVLLKTLLSPLLKRKLAWLKATAEQPSGSGDERMEDFA